MRRLIRFADTDYPRPPGPRDMLERVRTAHLQLTTLAASFGHGDLAHGEFLTRRRPRADDPDQVGRDLTAHNRAQVLAVHPAELSQRWATLSFRRAAACALLSGHTSCRYPLQCGSRFRNLG